MDLASKKISKPEHINELGVSRETAIVLGQVLSVKKEVLNLNHRMGKKFVELSRRLVAVEEHLDVGGEEEGEDGAEMDQGGDGC